MSFSNVSNHSDKITTPPKFMSDNDMMIAAGILLMGVIGAAIGQSLHGLKGLFQGTGLGIATGAGITATGYGVAWLRDKYHSTDQKIKDIGTDQLPTLL